MPRGDRNFVFAIIGFLVLSAVVWALMRPAFPNLPSSEYQKANDPEYGPGSPRCYPSRLARLPKREAPDERYRCEQGAEEHRLKSDDLIQQTRAADASVAMVDLTYRQTLLGLAGAIFGVLTLIAAAFAAWYARDAAHAARDSLIHSKAASAADLRPWLEVDIEAEWAIAFADHLYVSCIILIRNVGRAVPTNLRIGYADTVLPKIHTEDHETYRYQPIETTAVIKGGILPNGTYRLQTQWIFNWSTGGVHSPEYGLTPTVGVGVRYQLPDSSEAVTTRWAFIGAAGTEPNTVEPMRAAFDDDGRILASTTINPLIAVDDGYGEVT